MTNLPWFRAYTEMVDDEKLRLLAFEDRWHFVAMLCLKGQGVLDETGSLLFRKVAVKLGLDVRSVEEVARRLSEVGLIDEKTLQPIAWEARQFRSDSSAARVAAYRERKKQGVKRDGNVTVTAQDTDTDTDTDKKNTPLPPNGGDVLFAKFWSAYPRKVGKDVARKAFDKRKPSTELVDLMVQAVNRQKMTPQWAKDGGQFIPHPSTWINEGRWMDGEQAEQTKIWSDEYHAANKRAKWVIDAGFATSYDAQNARCHHKNAHEFCDGKRLDQA